MTHYNGILANHTSSVFGSWVAHGLGAVVALVLVVLTGRALRPGRKAAGGGNGPAGEREGREGKDEAGNAGAGNAEAGKGGRGSGSGSGQRAAAPLWSYLGGIPGAFTVMLASIAVNSDLELSGTIALMLVGQVLFGIVSDSFGLFGTPRRRLVLADFLVVLSVLAGSALIIFGGA
ncbi:DMT family transporter [Streptomyces sp. UNOC14_S4]|nr:DMT family transporter [Streptomyces sp. UNOC14_S4]